MTLSGPILGIWAHPDDEAFLSAGLMARAVSDGERVVCVTATRGELGVQDPERWPPDQLARIRENEMYESMRILGVGEHRWLDYPDGGCHLVDDEEAASRLEAVDHGRSTHERPDVRSRRHDGAPGSHRRFRVGDAGIRACGSHRGAGSCTRRRHRNGRIVSCR